MGEKCGKFIKEYFSGERVVPESFRGWNVLQDKDGIITNSEAEDNGGI